VEVARKTCCQASFERVFILIDEDLPIARQKTHKTLRALRAILFRSGPCCVEGFFLTVLGEKAPATSAECKTKFHQVGLSENQKLEPERYGKLFPMDTLDRVRARHPLLDDLIKLFSNVR
jgi:hypothetical protein